MTRRTPHYETDTPDPYPDAVRIAGEARVAWHVLGWETEPDEDTEWSGYETRTGRLVCVMVGDDRRFTFDPEDIEPLARRDYCAECGQIGCGHDGLDRDEETDEETDDDPKDGQEGRCAVCACDIHDGQCPEGHAQPTDD